MNTMDISRSLSSQVTVVMVHYRTPDLLSEAVESFYAHYPDVTMWIMENGSQQEEVDRLLEQLISKYSTLRVHTFHHNRFHGPAMDYALRNQVTTPFTFLLDSDTKTVKRGFLEEMLHEMMIKEAYSMGSLIGVNHRGFKDETGIRIPLTPYFMIRTDRYSLYPPFIHHGQPTLAHFEKALSSGERVLTYPIEQYIEHKWRGTASRYGYQLGWKARLDFLLNKLGF